MNKISLKTRLDIHSSLSQRFEFNYCSCSAVVIFDLEKKKSFNEGQMYVSLSKETSIGNLFLVGKCNCNIFKVNQNSVVEYSGLPKNMVHIIYTDYGDNNSLTVSLLNTRSLKRHTAEINRAR